MLFKMLEASLYIETPFYTKKQNGERVMEIHFKIFLSKLALDPWHFYILAFSYDRDFFLKKDFYSGHLILKVRATFKIKNLVYMFT